MIKPPVKFKPTPPALPTYHFAIFQLVSAPILTLVVYVAAYLIAAARGADHFTYFAALGLFIAGCVNLHRTWKQRKAWKALLAQGFTSQEIAASIDRTRQSHLLSRKLTETRSCPRCKGWLEPQQTGQTWAWSCNPCRMEWPVSAN
jgi:hypothetical protein